MDPIVPQLHHRTIAFITTIAHLHTNCPLLGHHRSLIELHKELKPQTAPKATSQTHSIYNTNRNPKITPIPDRMCLAQSLQYASCACYYGHRVSSTCPRAGPNLTPTACPALETQGVARTPGFCPPCRQKNRQNEALGSPPGGDGVEVAREAVRRAVEWAHIRAAEERAERDRAGQYWDLDARYARLEGGPSVGLPWDGLSPRSSVNSRSSPNPPPAYSSEDEARAGAFLHR